MHVILTTHKDDVLAKISQIGNILTESALKIGAVVIQLWEDFDRRIARLDSVRSFNNLDDFVMMMHDLSMKDWARMCVIDVYYGIASTDIPMYIDVEFPTEEFCPDEKKKKKRENTGCGAGMAKIDVNVISALMSLNYAAAMHGNIQ